ncbi:hypothetical protein GFO_1971 [Christiangramia forsetii KT0803]|uniref:Secreted protein n=1 Tax=Christiangramia forsetii (strain DSM 17595 / CGMCC 1.15422 / KT0803) TaxID=411154 RepID=A0M2U1_CHRFK|nr:hypothetical protein GFO_1971 [Christiangramia forsetii KT0803]
MKKLQKNINIITGRISFRCITIDITMTGITPCGVLDI